MKFLKYNANPYKVRTGDCVTRALVAGTRYGYATIADMLGLTLFKGTGVGDVPFDKLYEFAQETKIINTFDYELNPKWIYTQRDMDNFSNYGGMTMGFWLEHLSKNDVGASNIIFMVKLRPNDDYPEENSRKYHAIWGNLTTKEFADLEDTSGSIVLDMLYVDPSKMCPKNDPRYYLTEAK